MGDYGDLLTKFIAAATAGVGLCVALAKLVSLVQRSKTARNAKDAETRVESRRLDLESFEKIIDALEADNSRLREQAEAERKRHTEVVTQLETALNERRQQVHDLSNQLIRYQLEDDVRQHGRNPDENGGPR